MKTQGKIKAIRRARHKKCRILLSVCLIKKINLEILPCVMRLEINGFTCSASMEDEIVASETRFRLTCLDNNLCKICHSSE